MPPVQSAKDSSSSRETLDLMKDGSSQSRHLLRSQRTSGDLFPSSPGPSNASRVSKWMQLPKAERDKRNLRTKEKRAAANKSAQEKREVRLAMEPDC